MCPYMLENLYYLLSCPSGAIKNTPLSELAKFPGWEKAKDIFAAAETVPIADTGKALAAPLPQGAAASGFICGEVPSTFDLAWQLAEQGLLPCWHFVLAAGQSSGRGQLRRAWVSEPGNLYVSFRLPDDLNTEAGALLTGYLLLRALRALGVDVSLKWPNDLIQDKRKVGGILLEERGGVLLAGVGLNLRLAPDLSGISFETKGAKPFPPGVLRAGRGSDIPADCDIIHMWLKLVKQITLSYEKDLAPLMPEQRTALLEEHLAFKGARVTVHEPGFFQNKDVQPGTNISGVLAGLSAKGELRLLLSSGQELLLHSGSLSLE